MKISKIVKPIFVVALFFNALQAKQLNYSADATLVSDFIFRGESLSDGKPAAQVGLNVGNDLGWNYRLFLSTYDVNGDTDSRSEFSLNYRGEFEKYFDVLFGYKHYGYESEARSSGEWHFGLAAFNFSAIYHRDDSQDTEYFEYGYLWELDEKLSFSVHYGITQELYFDDSKDDYKLTANYVYSDQLSIFAAVGGQNESTSTLGEPEDFALVGLSFLF
ncbi:MAG: hypothetical protein HWE27_16595 [Gammaproteobacteria bacterium]|nr:hypothetical protein [Gammaproteobacteria bacterium]